MWVYVAYVTRRGGVMFEIDIALSLLSDDFSGEVYWIVGDVPGGLSTFTGTSAIFLAAPIFPVRRVASAIFHRSGLPFPVSAFSALRRSGWFYRFVGDSFLVSPQTPTYICQLSLRSVNYLSQRVSNKEEEESKQICNLLRYSFKNLTCH